MFFNSLFNIGAQTDSLILLSPSEYKAAIKRGNIQLVDVRTAQEYHTGHIKNAINIDFFQQSIFMEKFSKLDKSKPVYLYCRSGSRSRQAAGKLAAMGFTTIFDLKGGYMAWR